MPGKCLIYEVIFSMFEAIYIGKTQQILREIMDTHFSDLLHLLKNGQKSDSFAAHFGQHSNYTKSRTDIHKCVTSKLVKQINTIGAMKKYET